MKIQLKTHEGKIIPAQINAQPLTAPSVLYHKRRWYQLRGFSDKLVSPEIKKQLEEGKVVPVARYQECRGADLKDILLPSDHTKGW
ncbi:MULTISPECIES: hypothetical protein [unclassified Microcoleus]|uniref:hypothetical protein n=1 Tax=unclassified Microcoleus TaxID=2642155 RepID=UPI002FD62F09